MKFKMDEESLLQELKRLKEWMEIYQRAEKLVYEITESFRNQGQWVVTLHPGEDREDERHILWLLFRSRDDKIDIGGYTSDLQNGTVRTFIYTKNPVSERSTQQLNNLINRKNNDISKITEELKKVRNKRKWEKFKKIVKCFYQLFLWVASIVTILTFLYTYLMYKKM